MQSIVRKWRVRAQIRRRRPGLPRPAFHADCGPSSMVLNATVNQVDAEKLRLGMKCNVTRLDAYPEYRDAGSLIGIGALSKTSHFPRQHVGEIRAHQDRQNRFARHPRFSTGSAEIELNPRPNTLLAPRRGRFSRKRQSDGFPARPGGLGSANRSNWGVENFTTVAILRVEERGRDRRSTAHGSLEQRYPSSRHYGIQRSQTKQRLGRSHPRRVKIITGYTRADCGCGACTPLSLHRDHRGGSRRGAASDARFYHQCAHPRRPSRGAHSTILTGPQVPGLRIVHLADNGRPSRRAIVVVEFDPIQQEQNVIERTTSVRSADGDIEQLKATQVMKQQADSMSKMQAEYGVESARLDASKGRGALGSGWRPRTGISGSGSWKDRCSQVNSTINAHQVWKRIGPRRSRQAQKQGCGGFEPAASYLPMMQLRGAIRRHCQRAPEFPFARHLRQTPPPLRKATNAWTGAASRKSRRSPRCTWISSGRSGPRQAPDGPAVRVRVDAIPDKEFTA